MFSFVAVDFETADGTRESACAIGLVRVEAGEIGARLARLIRPPRLQFSPYCVRIHGITPAMVRHAPPFGDLWPEIAPFFSGVPFLAAHNAAFDRSVLQACCRRARIPIPPLPFVCTVQLARQVWSLPSARLPTVCTHLGIPLSHHDPASDALACARIVLAAARQAPSVLARFVPPSSTS